MLFTTFNKAILQSQQLIPWQICVPLFESLSRDDCYSIFEQKVENVARLLEVRCLSGLDCSFFHLFASYCLQIPEPLPRRFNHRMTSLLTDRTVRGHYGLDIIKIPRYDSIWYVYSMFGFIGTESAQYFNCSPLPYPQLTPPPYSVPSCSLKWCIHGLMPACSLQTTPLARLSSKDVGLCHNTAQCLHWQPRWWRSWSDTLDKNPSNEKLVKSINAACLNQVRTVIQGKKDIQPIVRPEEKDYKVRHDGYLKVTLMRSFLFFNTE